MLRAFVTNVALCRVQAEQELKEELEVKVALSSLVCNVADKASAQRLDQRASEEQQVETKRKAEATASKGDLRIELRNINAAIESIQTDLITAREWQKGAAELESKLLARMEELTVKTEVCKQRPNWLQYHTKPRCFALFFFLFLLRIPTKFNMCKSPSDVSVFR